MSAEEKLIKPVFRHQRNLGRRITKQAPLICGSGAGRLELFDCVLCNCVAYSADPQQNLMPAITAERYWRRDRGGCGGGRRLPPHRRRSTHRKWMRFVEVDEICGKGKILPPRPRSSIRWRWRRFVEVEEYCHHTSE
ncbi:hypothetical protein Adt_03173 [Abeliophyllum distichum]|uniref:Uncharacterized protein n=1 Tax=Abeliophyllum distichum TaxID=126358 RepID=A0ABD1W151_9LAMI